jgi:hypothetical protein
MMLRKYTKWIVNKILWIYGIMLCIHDVLMKRTTSSLHESSVFTLGERGTTRVLDRGNILLPSILNTFHPRAFRSVLILWNDYYMYTKKACTFILLLEEGIKY